MNDQHEQRVQRVVQHLKELLGADICNQVNEVQFQEIEKLVRTAIAKELEHSAELVETTAREIRGLVERRDMGM